MLADEFALTHRNVFTTARRNVVPLPDESLAREKSRVFSRAKTETPSNSLCRKSIDKRACFFFCLDQNHVISDCRAWKQKVAASRPKSAILVHTLGYCDNSTTVTCGYQPFLLDGTVSRSSDSKGKSVKILRDTGSVQSLII